MVIIEFITELYQLIPESVKWFIAIFFGIILVGIKVAEIYSAFKAKGLSGAVDKLLEVNGVQKVNKKYSQNFEGSNLKQEYRYNATTKEIIPTENKIDVQKQIDSYAHTSLENMLDRFMPVTETAESIAVANSNRMTDKLDELAKIFEVANGYREEYGLGSDMSINDIYSFINNKKSELDSKLAKYYETIKEVTPNEKKVEKESE